MVDPTPHSKDDPATTVAAGLLAPWQMSDLPAPPGGGWRVWASLLGPGVLLAGASIGTGEWLFGPAVSAQYGATLLWLATLSILGQLFANLVMMRYTLYCGEPILVGAFRTRPGPALWTGWYAFLELIGGIFPYNSANAAVPLAAALLGHLPRDSNVALLGVTLSEAGLVKLLGYCIFMVAFLPLVFGGTVYRMLERLMAAKIVVILSYLTFVAVFMVSGRTALDVCSGFFRFGSVPLRAETVVAARHFTITEHDDTTTYSIRGSREHERVFVTAFVVKRREADSRPTTYTPSADLPTTLRETRDRLVRRAESLTRRGGFFVTYTASESEEPVVLEAEGTITPDQAWLPERLKVTRESGRAYIAGGQPAHIASPSAKTYERLEDVPEQYRGRFRGLLANKGVERVHIVRYVREHGGLPDLDWAMLAAFAAIAGAGGMTNTLFSNYARDKGWGMGARVGAIPSAVGGLTVSLSHVGRVFAINEQSLVRWRGWLRHILRDQVAVWMLCCFVGMGLPCMLSLEFIRNAPVEGNRVAALTAEGIGDRFPEHRNLLWTATLLCGFLIIAPGQIVAADTVARRWTDILWTASFRVHRLGGGQVKYVYYTVLAAYAVCGLTTLAFFNPLQIAKLGAVFQNVALGFTALHALYVNRTLLPRQLRPNWFLQAGVIACGSFFLGISVVVLLTL